jgi:alpha-L-rhamnosidase
MNSVGVVVSFSNEGRCEVKRAFGVWVIIISNFAFSTVVCADIIVQQGGYSPTVSEQNETSDSYTIALGSAPTATVNVYPRQLCDPNQVVLPSVVTFTPANWSPKSVTITAIDDNLIETQPHYVVIRHSVSSSDPAYNNAEVQDVLVTINDNDCGSLGFLQEDLNFDCRVDFYDYAVFALDWLASTDPQYDLTGDDFADLEDVGEFADDWLACTAPAEPNCISAAKLTLLCEYLQNPPGVDVPSPRLIWQIETENRNFQQTAYQILVASSLDKLTDTKADLWNTGLVSSNQSLNVHYQGAALASGTLYYWKVRVWDGLGQPSHWSEPGQWAMGLMNPSDWAGIWINDGKPTPTDPCLFYNDDPAPLFRKEIFLNKPIARAMLYITGLGYYEASINGVKVGDSTLDPGWTTYSKRVPYAIYDVTDMLAEGDNCIGVMLGNGWYNPLPMKLFGQFNFREYLPVGRPRLLAQLNVEYTDGNAFSVATDTDWKVGEGAVLRNNVYLGAKYDARLESPGWDLVGFDDSAWADANQSRETIGPLRSQLTPPVRVTAIVKPMAITQPLSGVYIFDMGQNFAGVARLKVTASAGTCVHMRYGELLNPDGTLDVSTTLAGFIGMSWNTPGYGGPGAPGVADQNDVYICKGGGLEVYTPRFTFHGFRYLELTGFPGTPTLDAIEGLRMNSDVNAVGTFACSNPMFNRVWQMFDWTIRSNLFSVQSDCPGREKLGYGGDIVSSSEAVMFDLDMSNFYQKVVRDFNDAVRANGGFTETAPYVGIADSGLGGGSGPIGWGTAHPMLLWQLRKYYGNTDILAEQYDAMRNWVNLIDACDVNYIISNCIGDHAFIDPKPIPLTTTAFFYYNAKLCSDIAGLLGKSGDAASYGTLANNIKTAFNNKFFNSSTGVYSSGLIVGTQCCQAFPLYFDLVPSGYRDLVTSVLTANIFNHSGHLTTGIFGTKYMLDQLTATGNAYYAYVVANARTYPGYGNMLNNNATTIWESWDGGGSRNHPMFGSVCEWFTKTITGINPDPNAVGFDKIIIRPNVIAGLSWARGTYDSVRGKIESYWRLENSILTLDATIPGNTTALVYVPAEDTNDVNEGGIPALSVPDINFIGMTNTAAVFAVGSGHYHFVSTSPVINADTDPPTPSPMTWASVPAPLTSTVITMAATTATDLSDVEYFFDCLTAGGHDSGWQTSTSYTDNGLSPGTQYTYRVKASDKSSNHNETGYSGNASATTYPAGGIIFDSNSSNYASNEGNTVSWSHTIGSDPNRVLVVGVAAEDPCVNDLVVSSVKFNGVSMTFVPSSSITVGSTTRMKTDLYYLLDGNLPAAGTYTVTVTYAGQVDNRNGGAVSLAYVKQQAPEAVITNSNSNSGTISTNITTLTNGAWVVDVVGSGNPGSFTTTASGMVERWDVSADSSCGAASTRAVSTAGTVTLSWSGPGSGNRNSHSLAAFAPANAP